MWIVRFRLVHDCMFLDRCKRFKVSLLSVPLGVFKLKGKTATSSIHHATGDPSAIDRFLRDLQNQRGVIRLERRKDTFQVIETTETQAIRFRTPQLIFVKPVLISQKGYELWELASWDKQELSNFIAKTRKHVRSLELIKFVRSTMDNLFYPRLMPNLTKNQKRAMDLAIQEGYYSIPKKIDLRQLAKMMRISLSTFQNHLRRAEQKLIPQLLLSYE